LAADSEVTLEANPEDWTDELAHGLRAAGFNRVSFGAQSYDSKVLSSLGRQHEPEQIDGAVARARAAGFDSVSLDLIFGTPGESLAAWRTTVVRSIEAGVDHVSTYSLTVEPGTVLWKKVRSGADAPDPDDQADKWETARSILTDAGFTRYEVSNYARTDHHCRYNLAVWGQGEYVAVGLGAHGFRGGMRTANVRRLDTYIDRMERGIGPIQSNDVVEGWAAELERLMLGLRRAAGVVVGEGGAALLAGADGARLREAGVIDVVDGRLVVTRPLLTDEVTRTVLSLEPGA
jgi:oxygen-independent coproporphyrinogen-3 oxidase